MPCRTQSCAAIRCAAVLPNDGIVQGRARFAIPQKHGFTLIGDADGRNRRCGCRGIAQGGCDAILRSLPQIHGVMLDPARAWIVLGKLLLRLCKGIKPCIVNNRAGRGGALVNCKNMGHGLGPCRTVWDYMCCKPPITATCGQWSVKRMICKQCINLRKCSDFCRRAASKF